MPDAAELEQALDAARAERLARDRLIGLPHGDVDLFLARLRRWWPDLSQGLRRAYGDRNDLVASVDRIVTVLADRYRQRPEALKRLDLDRGLRPDWFQDPAMIGYVTYADRFAGSVAGVEERLPYLAELGVRYLHLMSVLQTRPGENDGGYAVMDYRAVEPRLGTMDDLEHLCTVLRERGISLCLDLVMNHCAAEHDWAVRARAGDPEAEAMFWIFPDRTEPDRYEATLPEVFPTLAPGNFSRIDGDRWVWTTFHEFQWDLDWSNPRVFVEMLDILLELAGRGVEVFRLDAVPFIWKRLGTNCQNQPEVHDLLQALRACARITAPAVVFKAEAIVSPDDLVEYLGTGIHHGRVSDLAYQNSLMVLYWSALATRDTTLMTAVLRDFPEKPASTAWATYIRCHDDIGWTVTDEDAASVGLDGPTHRSFLSDFYSGAFPGSFARGTVFQENPINRDRRISGTFASLAGLEQAIELDDDRAVDLAVDRILLGHTLILGWDGLPLLYMGDELGLLNDPSYLREPDLADDARWIHRPRMDWVAGAARTRSGTPIGRIFGGLRGLIEVRRTTPQFHAAADLRIVDLGDRRLFGFVRQHPLGPLLAVHNVTEATVALDGSRLTVGAVELGYDRIAGRRLALTGPAVALAPYGSLWLTSPPTETA